MSIRKQSQNCGELLDIFLPHILLVGVTRGSHILITYENYRARTYLNGK